MSRWLIATMTSVLFIALVIAVTGFEALLADVEVISQPDATPFLGPRWWSAPRWWSSSRPWSGARDGNPGVTGLVAAATAYLVMLGVGAVGLRARSARTSTELLVFPAGYALGPFVVGSVVVALLSVLGGITMARHQARTAGGSGAAATRPDGPDARSGHDRTNAGEEPAGR